MPFGDYLVGLVFFLGTVGAVALAALIVVQRRFAYLRGYERLIAISLLVLAGVIAVHLFPLALGVLDRTTALVAAIMALAGASRLRREPAGASSLPAPAGSSNALSWLIGGVAMAAVLVYTLAFLREHLTSAVTHSDYVSFTMPGIARWIQRGSVWQNIEFLPRYPVGAYPNNGDVWLLAFVVPWKNDAFVRLAAYPLVALTGLGVYALARELRAPAAPAVLFAAVVVATRAVTVPAIGYVKPDIFMLT